MTTPNTLPANGGVSDAEFPPLIEHMIRDYVPGTLQVQVRGAIRDFAQSRQPSAQGGEAIDAAIEALETCTIGGYRDVDGDWCERLNFDKDKIEAARMQLLAVKLTPPPAGGGKEALSDAERLTNDDLTKLAKANGAFSAGDHRGIIIWENMGTHGDGLFGFARAAIDAARAGKKGVE